MSLPLVDVNFIGVVAAAIASMVVGMIWYGPLFGKKWMGLMGFTKKDMEKAKKTGMAKYYIVAFISAVIMAYMLAYFITLVGANTIAQVVQLGFWIWLGFFATLLLSTVLWEGRSLPLYFLNVTHWLVTLVVMGIVIVMIG